MHTVGETYRTRNHNRSWLPGVILVAALMACSGGDKQAADQGVAAAPDAGPVASAAQAPGQQAYQLCATCHQQNGEGLPGAFPPLAGGEFANSSNPAVPISILIHGFQGPVTVKGQPFNSVMPAYGTGVEMSNEEVAEVLTYVRSSWGNTASAITADDVAKVKAAKRDKTGPVTAEELEAMK